MTLTNKLNSFLHSSLNFKKFLGSQTTLPAKAPVPPKPNPSPSPNNSDGILTPYPFGEPVNNDKTYYRMVDVIVNYKSKEGAIIPYSWKRSDAIFKASSNDTGISVANKIYFSYSFSESNSVIVCDFAYKLYNSTHKPTAGYLLVCVYNFTFTSDKHGN